ncbi:protein of unknown function DUF1009 [Desulfovibrio sp. X2]|uniref:LpxI family protein n=1 Tax=Desulfovibrio sp. X2 TaxID=941449 RepID=UPI00035897C1|nr:UDP-2,3-diacylglucosamine diphosphatase LpxI [Desulfovibrio sp. X2]EPR37470.1 protein of unknown function DUF1009 [Desulfovibrio sp. X2]
MAETVGIIAGGGQFPFLVAEGARAEGCRVAAVGFPRNTDPSLASRVDAYQELRLGQLGKLIAFFRAQGARRVIMAGSVNKARALDIRPDLRAAKLLFRLAGKGDDALLRAVAEELEAEGFQVVRAHEVVPGLLTPEGVLTRRSPSEEEWADIRFGWPMAKRIGEMDIGQTIVVRKQVVVAVEALEGTDVAVERGCTLAGPGAVVVKVFKPGQEERVDLPSVGLRTIELLARLQAGCLAVEAGRSLFFDRDEALAMADKAGLVVVGIGASFPSGASE